MERLFDTNKIVKLSLAPNCFMISVFTAKAEPHYMSKALPTRSENYSEWYNEVVKRDGLAENSAVRGCMVIKPYGFAIWEKMQRQLDDMFKANGHDNAYFPLFVPKSFLEKEEEHAEVFAKEC